jgi:hypothetical protein
VVSAGEEVSTQLYTDALRRYEERANQANLTSQDWRALERARAHLLEVENRSEAALRVAKWLTSPKPQ